MAHRFGTHNNGDESSDQEDLVDASGGSEMDDEVTDMDEMQFTYCKTDEVFLNSVDQMGESSSHGGRSNGNNKIETRLKLSLLGAGLILLISTFMLLFIHPLYLKQLEVGGDKFNAYGSLLFVSTIVTILFVSATAITSWISKWNIKIYQFPIPAKG